MIVVYRLKNDTDLIKRVERATRTTESFGVQPTHGMFGSDEWWRNVESGRLPIHTLRGAIEDVYMGSMGDWPEFRMISDAGEKSSWTREMNTADQNRFYRIGARIEIDYVWQRHRTKSFNHGAEFKQVIEIRIDPTSRDEAIATG